MKVTEEVYHIELVEEEYKVTLAEEEIKVIEAAPVIIDLDYKGSKLEKEINYDEFPASIGFLNNLFTTDKIVVEVIDEFDVGLMTIGDDEAHGRLVGDNEVDLLNKNIYMIENFVKYGEQTEIKAYMTGSPSRGRARIIIFYQ